MKARLHDRKRVWIGIGAVLALCFASASAQYRVSTALFKSSHRAPAQLASHESDSLQPDTSLTSHTFKSTKSAATAIALSAVLPGAGQIYTGRYWKVPLIIGFGGYFVVQMMRMDDHYRDSRSKYAASVMPGVSGGVGDPQLLYERDFYRDERDRFAFYVVLTYLLNIVDAFVGASLYDFDVEDNLGGGATVKFSVPLR